MPKHSNFQTTRHQMGFVPPAIGTHAKPENFEGLVDNPATFVSSNPSPGAGLRSTPSELAILSRGVIPTVAHSKHLQPLACGPPKLAYSMAQACELLSISRATLDREVARGRLRVVKVGCASRVTADDLTRYLASLPSRGAPNLTAEAS